MRPARPGEVLTAPPSGKALVNFHRPGDYHGNRVYSVFDRTRFVGANKGEQRFQYVCDPGVHVFIGYLEWSVRGTVRVIKATLKADKVYDCLIEAGYFISIVGLAPLDKARKNIREEEAEQETVVLAAGSGYEKYEAEMKARNEQILRDFLEGGKRGELMILGAEEHR